MAPTVLETLGLPVPKKMQGERLEWRAGHGAGYLRRLDSRLDAVLSHRSAALRVVVLSWILLLGGMGLVRRRAGLRAAARMIFLAALWLPALALLTAALAPSDAVEAIVLAVGSLALAAVSDRLLPWPAAPLIPAAVSFLAHTIDLALGSHLISLSLAGPNPKGGSRFFGIGNELEIVLCVTRARRRGGRAHPAAAAAGAARLRARLPGGSAGRGRRAAGRGRGRGDHASARAARPPSLPRCRAA